MRRIVCGKKVKVSSVKWDSLVIYIYVVIVTIHLMRWKKDQRDAHPILVIYHNILFIYIYTT